MITGKQRSYLRKLGQIIDPTVYIGKSGLSENIKTELENNFEARELVKVSVLKTCENDMNEIAVELCANTGAELVQRIGKTLVLFKRSKENKIILP